MTPQEIFDTVARHLFTQGHRASIQLDDDPESEGAGFDCRYRGPGGTKCAVGILIPDDAYDPRMEGCSAKGLFDPDISGRPDFRLPKWMGDEVVLLQSLQLVHDVADHWADDKRMRWELSLVATAYGLDDSVLPGLSFNRPEGQNA
jgi:hypothetical protein